MDNLFLKLYKNSGLGAIYKPGQEILKNIDYGPVYNHNKIIGKKQILF